MKKIDVSEYRIRSEKFQNGFSGYTFVMMSDLHSNVYRIDLHRVNGMIQEIKPDAVLIAGDMINSALRDDIADVTGFLKALAAHYPIFYALGNHEYKLLRNGEYFGYRYEIFRKYLSDAGVCFLEDRTVYLQKDGEKAAVSGVMIDSVFYRRNAPVMGKGLMDKHLGTPDLSCFQILLAHNPNYFNDYVRWGADLVLAGHEHGGAVRIPKLGGLVSSRLRFLPRYDAGLYTARNQANMILGRGMGAHTVPIRINNPPEVVLVKLLAKK